MKCPHCTIDFHANVERFDLDKDVEGGWTILRTHCPACSRFVFYLAKCNYMQTPHGSPRSSDILTKWLIRPKGATRPPLSSDVPAGFKEDYLEACLVLPDSAKASAALGRRCLQHLLREVAKVKHGDLYSEIQQVLDSGKLPSHIAESIDAVRNIGNFAAHPLKSTSTGEIVPVEPGEAEWTLDVLEMLFDFYFVQPAIAKRKRDALNAKLKDAGKPAMK